MTESVVTGKMPGVNISLQVNGRTVAQDVAPGLSLLDLLRDGLGLKGTHSGCDTAQCGACTVLVGGRAVKSCNVLAVQVRGKEVQTIEGLSPEPGTLNEMQRAFSRHHALQCGYCTPGFVMRAMAMINENVPAESAAVRHALGGNLCRCTGYEGIVRAVCEGLVILRKSGQAAPPS